MTAEEAMASLVSKFTSGNSVDVQSTRITRAEYRALRTLFHWPERYYTLLKLAGQAQWNYELQRLQAKERQRDELPTR